LLSDFPSKGQTEHPKENGNRALCTHVNISFLREVSPPNEEKCFEYKFPSSQDDFKNFLIILKTEQSVFEVVVEETTCP
jgi:hypothetical protein